MATLSPDQPRKPVHSCLRRVRGHPFPHALLLALFLSRIPARTPTGSYLDISLTSMLKNSS